MYKVCCQLQYFFIFSATMVWMVGMADTDGANGGSKKKKKKKRTDSTGNCDVYMNKFAQLHTLLIGMILGLKALAS